MSACRLNYFFVSTLYLLHASFVCFNTFDNLYAVTYRQLWFAYLPKQTSAIYLSPATRVWFFIDFFSVKVVCTRIISVATSSITARHSHFGYWFVAHPASGLETRGGPGSAFHKDDCTKMTALFTKMTAQKLWALESKTLESLEMAWPCSSMTGVVASHRSPRQKSMAVLYKQDDRAYSDRQWFSSSSTRCPLHPPQVHERWCW